MAHTAPAAGAVRAIDGAPIAKSPGLLPVAEKPAGGLAQMTRTRAVAVAAAGTNTSAFRVFATMLEPPVIVLNGPPIPAVLSCTCTRSSAPRLVVHDCLCVVLKPQRLA